MYFQYLYTDIKTNCGKLKEFNNLKQIYITQKITF